jgi:hypothetical protein
MKKFHIKRLDSVSIITNEQVLPEKVRFSLNYNQLDSVSIIANENVPYKKVRFSLNYNQ